MRHADKQKFEHAPVALRVLAERIQRGRGQSRIYHCQMCGYWHLTSQPARGRWHDAEAHGGLLPMLTLPGHDERLGL